MSTMFAISVHDAAGRVVDVKTCSGKCYRRNASRRTCICGGHNRGIGKRKALLNTLEWVEVWYQDYVDAHRTDYPTGFYFYLTFQLPLPGFETVPATPIL